MRKRWKLAAVAVGILALGLQACAPKNDSDCGFSQNVYGERLSWKGQIPVTLYIHSSVPSQFHGAIQQAADTWNRAAGKTLFVIAGTTPGQTVGRDGANVISMKSTWDSKDLSEQARTAVYWVGDQIQEADIAINGASAGGGQGVYSFYWSEAPGSGVNIEALVLHELGHVLGLKHNDGGGSVMATYLPANVNRTSLSEAEEIALKCEY